MTRISGGDWVRYLKVSTCSNVWCLGTIQELKGYCSRVLAQELLLWALESVYFRLDEPILEEHLWVIKQDLDEPLTDCQLERCQCEMLRITQREQGWLRRSQRHYRIISIDKGEKLTCCYFYSNAFVASESQLKRSRLRIFSHIYLRHASPHLKVNLTLRFPGRSSPDLMDAYL